LISGPTRLSGAAAALLLCGASLAHAEILIGTAGPMAGPNQSFGEEMRHGAQAAVDDINATGGLKGEPLKLVVGDDGCDPRKAVDVATSFVSQGVKFVDGHFCSGSSIPAAKVYETANIALISPASTNPKLTEEGGWNIIRLASRDDAQGTIAGRYIVDHYRDKPIAILNDKSPAGTALAGKVREALSAAGMTATIDEAYAPGAKDYGDLAQKIADSQIDVLYIGGTYAEAGLIIRELRDFGSEAQLIGGDGLVTDEFWTIAKDAGEGTLMTFQTDPQKLQSAKGLVQRFATDGFNPEGATLNAYSAVQAFVQAAEATGGTDGHKIADWLRAGNRVNTVVGELTFDSKGDLKEPQFAWFRWSQGKYGEAEDLNGNP
jgi:branched-chain amino acid transport system substrate-binding protein